MIGAFVGMAAAAGTAAADVPDTTPPASAPTNLSAFTVNRVETGIQWVNADADSNTQIGRSSSSSVEPTSELSALLAPGETIYETGDERHEWWWARHYRNGQYSAWTGPVQAPGADGGSDTGISTEEDEGNHNDPLN